jgi:hypothetical protein
MGGGGPAMPKPNPPPIPPDETDQELRDLARSRKQIDDSRKGRSQLVIPPDSGPGLRIQ